MTNIRCLATNCEFNSSCDKNTYGVCQKEDVDITVWDADEHEYMACKSFRYGKPVKYRGE